MIKSDFATVRIYNNEKVDVELENKTIYTTKANIDGWIRVLRTQMKEVAHKRYDNGDETYWFN